MDYFVCDGYIWSHLSYVTNYNGVLEVYAYCMCFPFAYIVELNQEQIYKKKSYYFLNQHFKNNFSYFSAIWNKSIIGDR